jgi:hypothetical protein
MPCELQAHWSCARHVFDLAQDEVDFLAIEARLALCPEAGNQRSRVLIAGLALEPLSPASVPGLGRRGSPADCQPA